MKLDPVVDVVVVLAVVLVVVVGVGAEAELDVAVGDGDTIAGDVVEVVVALVVAPDAPATDLLWDSGCALSFGMPLAKGSRGTLTRRARTGTRAVVRSTGATVPARGGAGGTGITFAAAFFRSVRGTATTATSRSTMTGHSLRWNRSRRRALIINLRG
jgi:hypothetical protein